MPELAAESALPTDRRERPPPSDLMQLAGSAAWFLYFAKSESSERKALISRLLPEGSRKNIVACSPG